MSDVARLLGLFDKLLSQGLTIIVVEHNLDVIAHGLIETGKPKTQGLLLE